MIFENSSPKGILRQIMNNVPKISLSSDSQYYQGGALKELEFYLCLYIETLVMFRFNISRIVHNVYFSS